MTIITAKERFASLHGRDAILLRDPGGRDAAHAIMHPA